MKYLSRRDIEIISDKIIYKYKQLPEVDGKNLCRVEPDLLIEKLLGLTIAYEHLSPDGSILGGYSPDEIAIEVFDSDEGTTLYATDANTLLIEKDLQEDKSRVGRCNYTKMHEAGHYIMGRLDKGSSRPAHYYRVNKGRHKITNWQEWQADTLASFLLMPQECVMRCLHEFGLDNGIAVLNSLYRPEEYCRFLMMSRYMGVSKQALAIRLKQLGMLGECYLEHPKKILDIEYGE